MISGAALAAQDPCAAGSNGNAGCEKNSKRQPAAQNNNATANDSNGNPQAKNDNNNDSDANQNERRFSDQQRTEYARPVAHRDRKGSQP
jgi:hypothetical protein